MPLVVLQTAKVADRIDFMDKTARTEITNKIGVPMMSSSLNLSDKEIKEYTALMEKNKKPAEFFLDFDGQFLTYGMRIGSTKKEFTSMKLTTDGIKVPDLDKARDNLVNRGVMTKKQLEALKERNM